MGRNIMCTFDWLFYLWCVSPYLILVLNPQCIFSLTCVFIKEEPTKDLGLYLVHHVVASSCFYMSLINEEYHYFCAIRLWSELSTPFLNLIWILKELKYEKSSKAYGWNALCFTISFFLWWALPNKKMAIILL